VLTVGAQRTEGSRKNELIRSLQHYLQYADKGEDMLNRIVTGDKSWVHHYQPESKHASMQWKHPSLPSTEKFKITPSAGIVGEYW
jgi:protein involved in ribonucleotide reduction